MKHAIPLKAGYLSMATIVLAFLTLTGKPAMAAQQTGSIETYRKGWSDVSRRIDENIERNRKGDATIEITGEDGQLVKDAILDIQQKTHEFLFGCNAFVLHQLKTEEMNKRYEDGFAKLFNFATIPIYWEGTEPSKGKLRYSEPARDMWRRPTLDRFFPWAERNGITLKGHPMLWAEYNPKWLPKDPVELKELYRKRFKELSERYADKIFIWDVVNESQVEGKGFPLYTPDRAYVGWAFKEVAPQFPDETILMINEVTKYNFIPAETNPYFAQVKELLEDGVKVRGIGFQYHYGSTKSDPAKLLDLYEQFASFKLPLYVTEITFTSGGDDGDALQAEKVRDHYRLWFCAPMMAGITWWNLGDGTGIGGLKVKDGLMDEQLLPKSSYRVLDKLINEDWKTKTQVKTDAQGKTKFRGFYGKYSVKVTAGDQTKEFEIDLSKDNQAPYKLALEK